MIISNIQKYLLIQYSVTLLIFTLFNYSPLAGSKYIKIPKQLDHPRKNLINFWNLVNDNECLKWCLVEYLHPTDHNPRRIRKADKFYKAKWDFKDIKFLVKVRDIHKIERKIPSKLVFLVMNRRSKIQSTCQRNVVEINMLIYYW